MTVSGDSVSYRQPLHILAERVKALSGIRRIGLALLLGAAAAAALPPVYAVPLLVPAFVGLVWLIDGSRTWRRAAAIGWWFGLGHFIAGTYWISISLLVDAARFAWMVPFAVIGISGYLALFPALAALLQHLSRTHGLGRILVFAAAWTVSEWLRGVVLTGFAWNLLGTVWVFSDAMIQLASVAGVLGLSLVTVLVAALPAALADRPARDDPASRTRRRAALATAAAGLLGIWLFGSVRLAGVEVEPVANVKLRIVQPNIAQEHKWRRDLLDDNFIRHLRLSIAERSAEVTHVIWPEAASPFPLSRYADRRLAIGAAVPPGGVLITGAPRTTPPGEKPFRIWNSLYAIDGHGTAVTVYDKHHLVPFGEFMPLRQALTPLGIDKITPGAVDFSPGPGLRTLQYPGLPPASPLICYEAIFPGEVVAAGARPGWLLNVTNDAWFGRSSGPYQHFASARLRAVEEGLPLVRAANTGISAVVDPYGRVVVELGLGEEGVIDAPLPSALAALTPFARLGNWTAGLLIVLVAAVGWGAGRRA